MALDVRATHDDTRMTTRQSTKFWHHLLWNGELCKTAPTRSCLVTYVSTSTKDGFQEFLYLALSIGGPLLLCIKMTGFGSSETVHNVLVTPTLNRLVLQVRLDMTMHHKQYWQHCVGLFLSISMFGGARYDRSVLSKKVMTFLCTFRGIDEDSATILV